MEKDSLQKTFDDLVASRDAVEEAVRQVIDENASLMQELQKLRGTSLRWSELALVPHVRSHLWSIFEHNSIRLRRQMLYLNKLKSTKWVTTLLILF